MIALVTAFSVVELICALRRIGEAEFRLAFRRSFGTMKAASLGEVLVAPKGGWSYDPTTEDLH
jgi:hypothetical protein